MKVEKTALSGVVILTPRRFKDDRGFFAESWNRQTLEEQDIFCDFVQDNHSQSQHENTVRGLHFQSPPYAQTKLVRCGQGSLFDVVVDIRRGSPEFGQWIGVELTAENGRQLYIPEGFAHGFVTRAPMTEIIYKCSSYYSLSAEGVMYFDDPDVGIDWGIDTASAILSEKDAAAPRMRDIETPFTY